MGKRDRAQEPQAREPHSPRGALRPPGDWSTPPQRPPPSSPYPEQADPRPKKRRRVFLWVFLAVQVLFVAGVILGATSGSDIPEACQGLTGDNLELCKDANGAGTAIGVGLIIGLWAAVDIILGFTYLVYRLASRRT